MNTSKAVVEYSKDFDSAIGDRILILNTEELTAKEEYLIDYQYIIIRFIVTQVTVNLKSKDIIKEVICNDVRRVLFLHIITYWVIIAYLHTYYC